MPTAAILLQTLLHGRPVGRDSLNNRYFEEKSPKNPRHPRRWVVYNKKNEDASAIPAAWHAWIHHTTKTPPNQSSAPRLRHAWQKPHNPNPTGTPQAVSPKRHQPPKPYQAWSPPSSP